MKKFLLSLLLFFGLGLSFCSAETLTFTGTLSKTYNQLSLDLDTCDYIIRCSFTGFSSTPYVTFYYNYNVSASYTTNFRVQAGFPIYIFDFSNLYYSNVNNVCYHLNYFRMKIDTDNGFFYDCSVFPVNSSCPTCPTCPSQYTSQECQTEYSLVPSSDLSSCQSSLSGCQTSLSGWNNTLNNCSNNLLSCESSLSSCIQSNCPFDTGSVQWSALWINGIQHLGKPVINIDIPGQIYWDYTTDDEEFNLYVGSGYDQEYIDNVIAINSYHPTSEDFTSVFVGGLTLIMPYIFIALLILFIRKLVKRIFK